MKQARRNGRMGVRKTQRIRETARGKRVSWLKVNWFAILMLTIAVGVVTAGIVVSAAPTAIQVSPVVAGGGKGNEKIELEVAEPDHSKSALDAAATVPVGAASFDGHGNLYDAAGNMLFDGLYDYQYDAWNRLTKVTRAFITKDSNGNALYNKGSTVVTLHYDGLGRLVKRDIRNCGDLDYTYLYFYDHHHRLIEERNGSGQTLKTYVWGQEYIDELVQINVHFDANGTFSNSGPVQSFWVVQDANYNVIGVVNESGRLVERYEYTPHGERTIYGRLRVLSDVEEAAKWANDALLTYPQLTSARICDTIPVSLCEFGWQGLRHDPVSDLIDNRSRMYSPRLARFMQRDPAGYVDGTNLYLSRQGNPVRYADPSGFYGTDIHKNLTTDLARMAGINDYCAEEIGKWADAPDSWWREPGIVGVGEVVAFPIVGGVLAGPVGAAGGLVVSSAKVDAMAEWHFPVSPNGLVEPGSAAAYAKVATGLTTCNVKDFAEGLHVYQDSWSHQGKPYILGVGHGRGYNDDKGVGTGGIGAAVSGSADKVDYWPATTRQMAMFTYNALLQFAKHCPNHCPPDPETKCRITAPKKATPYKEVEEELNRRYPGEDKVK